MCWPFKKLYSYICTHVTIQQRWNFRQTYIHTLDTWPTGQNLVFMWLAAYSNTWWTLNKHFIVTMQRNMDGGTTGAHGGGGCLGPMARSELFRMWLMEIAAWGEELWWLCPPRMSHRLPKSARDNTGWVHGRPPLLRASMPPPRAQILYFCGNINNKQPKGFGWLNGRASRVFYTRVRRLLTHW
jgi:hypothetical protein